MKNLDAIAIQYVRLVLATGAHDGDFVDAYYGPAAWQEEVKSEALSLEGIEAKGRALIVQLQSVHVSESEQMLTLRHQYLLKQTSALVSRIEIISGRRIAFDDESSALYDAVAPHRDDAYFMQLQAELGKELPGEGSLATRVGAFQNRFIIPPDKLDTVFLRSIDECRNRTLNYLTLPEGESFTVEYVKDKPWSGYNWYQGSYRSVIQVNTDLPIFIDRAIDLACHEGYPGHHVYNLLLEKNMVRDRGWVEFTVYALFSPQSLIAEGSANYGIDVAFPGPERIGFETRVLFPLAGLDPSTAERYYRIQGLLGGLAESHREAARRYLDGEFDADATVQWLVTFGLSSPERAKQRIRFYDKYRSYIINYTFGQDLVREHIEAASAPNPTPEKVWREFRNLISSPRLPSGLMRKEEH